MSKQFLAVLLAIIIIFVGIITISGHKSAKTTASSSSATPSSHVEGTSSTGVKLVEYGDYECPYCGEYFPAVKQVQSDYNNLISFQFRNFPLVNVHQNAFAGARAAEAASLQNQFWQMHDLLYENQDTWSASNDPTTYFDQYATALGLNVKQFDTDYASSKVNDTINADMAVGNKLGIDGTPTFYLDGTQIQVADSEAAFEKVINTEITKKDPSATNLPGASTAASTSAGTTAQTKQ
jgi:protein-disulfide isomerase